MRSAAVRYRGELGTQGVASANLAWVAFDISLPRFRMPAQEIFNRRGAGIHVFGVWLLRRNPVTTTQTYDKRRRSTSEGVSHLLTI